MTISADSRIQTTGAIAPVPPAGEASTAHALAGGTRLDIEALAADIREQQAADPEQSSATLAELERMLTPVERGQLAAALDGAREHPANDNGRAGQGKQAQLALDLGQMALDITGVIDPVPISDGGNPAASAGRAFGTLFSGSWSGSVRAVDAVRSFDNAADFNLAANDADPNTRYEYGNYSYSTDAQGRVEIAEGEIALDPAGRNDPSLQRQIGHEGRDTDVGFHIVADRFGGQTNRLNVVPGNGKPLGDGQPNLNQGAYSRFEDRIAELAEQPGNRVEVRIEMNYDGDNATARPDSFDAAYRVNEGRWIEQSFINK